jgi:hypothetical protein
MSPSNDLSIFDILNIFWHCWFLSRASLLGHIVAAQKVANSKIEWVEFNGPFHSHLVKCACVLVPRPVQKVKKVMFCFLFKVLNDEVPKTFFDLPLAAKLKGECHLIWQKWCSGGQAATMAPPSQPEANGGKKCVVGEVQEPWPTLVVLDQGPFPRLHGAPVNHPSPPMEPPPSPSPLLSLILKAPTKSTLYLVGDNPSYDEWAIPDAEGNCWLLWGRLCNLIGELSIHDWEVMDWVQWCCHRPILPYVTTCRCD